MGGGAKVAYMKTPLFTLVSSTFPCSNAAGQLKHIYTKSFKDIVFLQCFYNVVTMFSIENTVIYTFFGVKSVQNTGLCSVFNALASKNIQNIAIYNVFSFFSVFPLPEAYQNNPKFHFNTLLSSDTQKSLKHLVKTT